MSKYLPKFDNHIQTDVRGKRAERMYVAHLQVSATNAVAAGDVGVHAAITLADGVITEATTNITNPKVPRALRIKGNVAGITGDVVIEGTNYNDEPITETIAASGGSRVEGNKAFKTITKITVPARNAEGDTISIGWNDKLGLPYKLAHNTVLTSYYDNTLESTAATVTVSATEIESNTIDLNTALSGKQVDVYLIV
jgi:hypothetical protein